MYLRVAARVVRTEEDTPGKEHRRENFSTVDLLEYILKYRSWCTRYNLEVPAKHVSDHENVSKT